MIISNEKQNLKTYNEENCEKYDHEHIYKLLKEKNNNNKVN